MDVFANVAAIVKAAARAALEPAGKALADEVRRRVSVPGLGVPSAPGEPPRKQTGGLLASIRHEVDPTSLEILVIADHPAAFYLEYGTQRMAARPFLRPAVVSFSGRAAQLIANRMGGGVGSFAAARHAPGVLTRVA